MGWNCQSEGKILSVHHFQQQVCTQVYQTNICPIIAKETQQKWVPSEPFKSHSQCKFAKNKVLCPEKTTINSKKEHQTNICQMLRLTIHFTRPEYIELYFYCSNQRKPSTRLRKCMWQRPRDKKDKNYKEGKTWMEWLKKKYTNTHVPDNKLNKTLKLQCSQAYSLKLH